MESKPKVFYEGGYKIFVEHDRIIVMESWAKDSEYDEPRYWHLSSYNSTLCIFPAK